MTTVAYRNATLAADRRSQVNGWSNTFEVPKVFQLTGPVSGCIAAVTGDYATAIGLIAWLQSPSGDRPNIGDNARVIVLRAWDDLTIYEGGSLFGIKTSYAAWGSGMPAASAALIMGASAQRAVEIASMLDDATGPIVDIVSLNRDSGGDQA